MGREQNLERLEERRSLPGAFEDIMDLLFVLLRHGGNDRLLVGEIAIDQPHADAGFGADIVHARLVKAVPGEANHGGLKDLGPAFKPRLSWDLRHWNDNE